MRFQLDLKEQLKATKMMAEHRKICTVPDTAIGGDITYSFTPTSLGTIIKLTCFCGKECDVTDYDAW